MNDTPPKTYFPKLKKKDILLIDFIEIDKDVPYNFYQENQQ